MPETCNHTHNGIPSPVPLLFVVKRGRNTRPSVDFDARRGFPTMRGGLPSLMCPRRDGSLEGPSQRSNQAYDRSGGRKDAAFCRAAAPTAAICTSTTATEEEYIWSAQLRTDSSRQWQVLRTQLA